MSYWGDTDMDAIVVIVNLHRGSALVVGDGAVRSMDTQALQNYLSDLLTKRAAVGQGIS